MKLSNQVCSLELAKKLKELGVEQDSLFEWVENYVYGNEIKNEIVIKGQYTRIDLMCLSPIGLEKAKVYSAFTVAELGEMLNNINWSEIRVKYTKKWEQIVESVKPFQFRLETEANARAKMLIYLLENKLINL